MDKKIKIIISATIIVILILLIPNFILDIVNKYDDDRNYQPDTIEIIFNEGISEDQALNITLSYNVTIESISKNRIGFEGGTKEVWDVYAKVNNLSEIDDIIQLLNNHEDVLFCDTEKRVW